MEIIWKPQAIKDLEAIEEFYLKTAPAFAVLIVDQIHSRVGQLREHPRSGRMVPEIEDPEIRELIYQNYRIIYVIDSRRVEILTVFHSSKQF